MEEVLINGLEQLGLGGPGVTNAGPAARAAISEIRVGRWSIRRRTVVHRVLLV